MEKSKRWKLLSELICRQNETNKYVVALQGNDFSYVWEIKNFKNIYLENLEKSIKSPIFNIGVDSIQWQLELNLNQGSSDKFDFYIWSLSTFNERIYFIISIIDKDNRDRVIMKYITNLGYANKKMLSKNFIKKDLVLKSDDLLVNDSFIIKCVIQSEKNNVYFDRNPATFDDQVFTLNRSLKELEHFKQLFKTAKFSDVKLVVEDKEFRAHKFILSMFSPVFSAMFRNDVKENIENLVEITDVKYEVMQEVLRYIYTGEVKNFTILAKDILAVAHKYEITILQDLCEDVLINTTCIENIEEILALADLYNAYSLKNYLHKFLKFTSRVFDERELFDEIMDSMSEPLKLKTFEALRALNEN